MPTKLTFDSYSTLPLTRTLTDRLFLSGTGVLYPRRFFVRSGYKSSFHTTSSRLDANVFFTVTIVFLFCFLSTVHGVSFTCATPQVCVSNRVFRVLLGSELLNLFLRLPLLCKCHFSQGEATLSLVRKISRR